MVSEEPQPAFFRFRFPSTQFLDSSPEVAPKESLRYNASNSVSSRNARQNVGGRVRRQQEMLRLVREYLQGTLLQRF